MRQSVFYPAIFGYVIGIFIRSFLLLSFSFQFLAACVLIIALIIFIVTGSLYDAGPLRRYSITFLIMVGLTCAIFGTLRYSFFTLYQGDPALAAVVGKHIRAEGVVVAEPDERTASVRLTVALDTLTEQDSDTEDHSNIDSNNPHGEKISIEPTNVIMSADSNISVKYGDRVSIVGSIVRPENFAGDNGQTFNYISYLAKDRIFYEMNYPSITLVSSGHGNSVERLVLFLKDTFLTGLDAVIPAPESSLGAGLVIAGKRALPPDIETEFERTGTIQIVVLSGYNVTVVAETLASIFSFMPLALSAAFSVGGILVFTIAAGATATVIRASIMALIVITAQLARRRYNVLRALIFSAFLMLVGNPLLLAFDPSFQLSFIATLGLILVSPMIEKYFLFLPETLIIRATAVATVATQIFVLPFILYLTGTFSLVAVPANLLLFLFIPMTMLFCFVAGIFGSLTISFGGPLTRIVHTVTRPLAVFSALPATALLHYELLTVHFFALFPFAAFSITAFPAWCMSLVYAGYGVVIALFYRMKPSTISEIKF